MISIAISDVNIIVANVGIIIVDVDIVDILPLTSLCQFHVGSNIVVIMALS